MDQLEKCMQSLRVLIASADDGGIILAEKAVNEYLAAFPVMTPSALLSRSRRGISSACV